jgi:hypothetical protein
VITKLWDSWEDDARLGDNGLARPANRLAGEALAAI